MKKKLLALSAMIYSGEAFSESASSYVINYIDAITTTTFGIIERSASITNGVNKIFYALLAFAVIYETIQIIKKLGSGRSFFQATWKFAILILVVLMASGDVNPRKILNYGKGSLYFIPTTRDYVKKVKKTQTEAQKIIAKKLKQTIAKTNKNAKNIVSTGSFTDKPNLIRDFYIMSSLFWEYLGSVMTQSSEIGNETVLLKDSVEEISNTLNLIGDVSVACSGLPSNTPRQYLACLSAYLPRAEGYNTTSSKDGSKLTTQRNCLFQIDAGNPVEAKCFNIKDEPPEKFIATLLEGNTTDAKKIGGLLQENPDCNYSGWLSWMCAGGKLVTKFNDILAFESILNSIRGIYNMFFYTIVLPAVLWVLNLAFLAAQILLILKIKLSFIFTYILMLTFFPLILLKKFRGRFIQAFKSLWALSAYIFFIKFFMNILSIMAASVNEGAAGYYFNKVLFSSDNYTNATIFELKLILTSFASITFVFVLIIFAGAVVVFMKTPSKAKELANGSINGIISFGEAIVAGGIDGMVSVAKVGAAAATAGLAGAAGGIGAASQMGMGAASKGAGWAGGKVAGTSFGKSMGSGISKAKNRFKNSKGGSMYAGLQNKLGGSGPDASNMINESGGTTHHTLHKKDGDTSGKSGSADLSKDASGVSAAEARKIARGDAIDEVSGNDSNFKNTFFKGKNRIWEGMKLGAKRGSKVGNVLSNTMDLANRASKMDTKGGLSPQELFSSLSPTSSSSVFSKKSSYEGALDHITNNVMTQKYDQYQENRAKNAENAASYSGMNDLLSQEKQLANDDAQKLYNTKSSDILGKVERGEHVSNEELREIYSMQNQYSNLSQGTTDAIGSTDLMKQFKVEEEAKHAGELTYMTSSDKAIESNLGYLEDQLKSGNINKDAHQEQFKKIKQSMNRKSRRAIKDLDNRVKREIKDKGKLSNKTSSLVGETFNNTQGNYGLASSSESTNLVKTLGQERIRSMMDSQSSSVDRSTPAGNTESSFYEDNESDIKENEVAKNSEVTETNLNSNEKNYSSAEKETFIAKHFVSGNNKVFSLGSEDCIITNEGLIAIKKDGIVNFYERKNDTSNQFVSLSGKGDLDSKTISDLRKNVKDVYEGTGRNLTVGERIFFNNEKNNGNY
jgi:hypothetical protein